LSADITSLVEKDPACERLMTRANPIKGQIAEFIEDNEVHAGQVIGKPTLPSIAGFNLETIDEIDHVVEPASGARSNAAASDRNRKMGFAGAGSSHQHGITLFGQESATASQ
jgi:hypothetical protein